MNASLFSRLVPALAFSFGLLLSRNSSGQPFNPDLASLTLSAGTLSPPFAASVTNYTASVSNTVANITVTPTSVSGSATIQVRANGGGYSNVTSGSASAALALNVGTNSVDVRVTSANGSNIKTYTVAVTRAAPSTNANLSALTLSSGPFAPAFNSNTVSYVASVPNSTNSITATPTSADASATIQARVNGGGFSSVISGSPSSALALNVGPNTIDVRVTAQDGTTIITYSVVVIRAEPLSAAARTTPLVISEIMPQPGGTNAENLEFVELYNSNPYVEDISGYRLSGEMAFTFPSNTVLQGGSYLVVAKDPAALQNACAYSISNLCGPFANSLPGKGSIRLEGEKGQLLLQVDYASENPWPAGADGTGHSLVLLRPSYGQNDPFSWAVSDHVGGSPGTAEPTRVKTGLRSVMINEILAHSDLPLAGYVELYNYSVDAVDVSDCWLSDAASTNKFRIPASTTLPPHGYLAFNETTLGFTLDHTGETIYFRSPDGQRMLDAVQFATQENGVAYGRYPDGSGEWYRLAVPTAGTNNAPIRVDDVVINEIMYAPISELVEDQYLELYNQGTNPVNLSDWKFTQGIDFKFPPNAILPAGGYVVVAKNAARMLSNYQSLNSANTFGNFYGQLSRDGERVALAKPEIYFTTNGMGNPVSHTRYIVVEEVSYKSGGRWGKWANQGGSSLELIDSRANHRMADNWADSDETGKAPWTFFEHTGTLDTGSTYLSSAIDRLEVIMLGEGECLLDDVEVSFNITNKMIGNGSFESGIAPWTPQGNHVRSTLETSLSPYRGGRSLHIRSSGEGDTGANRIRVAITAFPFGQTNVTIQGNVRWLRGWPEITLRLKGGFLEAYARMQVPSNLGTPGAVNSRALTNAAPAIYGVVHTPTLPQAAEPVVVAAGVQDPDGVNNVTLFYRVDSDAPPPFTALAMNDAGTNGDTIAQDGIYTATIPAQVAGTMVGFYVAAADTRNVTNFFPTTPLAQRECLVRWSDPVSIGAFASYRIWLSRANVSTYTNRPALSREYVDGTMVVNDQRPIYNMLSHYVADPYHQGQNTSPESGGQHYNLRLPPDDKYLGTENFDELHAPGDSAFDDPTLLREQTVNWLARQVGLPYQNRRYVAMYINGTRKGGANALQEDAQQPGKEMVGEFFPGEGEGRLYELKAWFEFDDVSVTGGSAAAFDNKLWCTLTRNLSGGTHKITRYRQNFVTRNAHQTANEYTNVIALIEAANVASSNVVYWQNLSELIDVEQWAHTFAVEHAVGNWDGFGGVNENMMYAYKPHAGKWKLIISEANIALNNPNQGGIPSNPAGANLFDVQSGQDPPMAILNAYPPFRRAWWRAYKELAAGPMLASRVDPIIDARYNAFVTSGVVSSASAVAAVKTFIATARTGILSALATNDVNGFSISNTNISTANSNLVTFTGTAALDITSIEFNGVSWPITWISNTVWRITLPVTSNTLFTVVAYDQTHHAVGATNTASVNYSAGPAPDSRAFIAINEIMYSSPPDRPDSEYVELFNTHSNAGFNLGGWRVSGIDYTFPAGAYIRPREYLVLARNRVGFSSAYGANIPVFDQFDGTFENQGETIGLFQPAAASNLTEVVIDKVRYETVAPWSTNAANTGSSLQLVDVNQDNSRVGNWASAFTPATYTAPISTPAFPRDGWRFFSATGSIGSGDGGGIFRLLIYLGEPGSALIDDLSLVAGTNAAVGPNYLRNGDFESPLDTGVTNSWRIGTNCYGNTFITSTLVHGGNGALQIVGTNAAGAANPPSYDRSIFQFISSGSAEGAPSVNSTCTLSFWYWATNSATNLLLRIRNSAALSTGGTGTNINVFITPSNYVPPMLISAATNSFSPGLSNRLNATIPAFPPLWINEVQAENNDGITDNRGDHDPWIEIYNTSTNTVALAGLYLTDTYANYTNWAFPAGSSIGPTQFLVVFCDGEPDESTNTEYHTSFRLAPGTGGVALSRLFASAPQVMDYVNYGGLPPNRSQGSYPDGQPFDRQQFFYVTAGGTNDGRSAPLLVFINEWMARNASTLQDPADNDYDGWFELYNPGTNVVDLAGYYLTDALTNKFKQLITTNGPHTIGAHGHLLVWADREPEQNLWPGYPSSDLHVNFQFPQTGGAIGLFAADGTQIDILTVTNQPADLSAGRYPDGAGSIYPMPGSASPREANYLVGGANTPPVLDPIGSKALYLGETLAFTATGHDDDLPPQGLGFTLDSGAPAGAAIVQNTGAFGWHPAAVGNYNVTVRLTDTGTPPASDSETITIQVLAAPTLNHTRHVGGNIELDWNASVGRRYAVEYKNDLTASAWIPLGTNTATSSSLSFTNATTGALQRFFRVRVLP